MILFAIEAAKAKGLIDEKEAERWHSELKKIPEIHKRIQEASLGFFEDNYKSLIAMDKLYVIGCGANFSTALECALKIGETVCIPSIAYEAEEMIHGPNLQLDPTYHLFFIDGGCASERVYNIFKASRIVTEHSYMVTNNEKYKGNGVLAVPFTLDELITPLCFLPFVQIMAYKITEETSRWNRCPLFKKMEEAVTGKTPGYKQMVND